MLVPEAKDFELLEQGTHVATCFAFIDLGTQDGQYGPKRTVRVMWEIDGKLREDGKPFIVSALFNFSDEVLREIHDEIASRVFDLIQDICNEREICPGCYSAIICSALGGLIAGSILAESADEAKAIVKVIAKGIGSRVRVRSPEHHIH